MSGRRFRADSNPFAPRLASCGGFKIPGGVTRIMKIPWASLLLIFLVLASYLYFGAEPYASSQAIGTFGLASWNLAGVFTSEFMHQGFRHLLANILPLATFAVLLETVMSAGGVLAIFFAAGAAGGLIYLLFDPGALVIGASAASSGLMAAATVLRPKQAIFLALFIAVLALLFVGPASDFFTSQRKTQVYGDVATLSGQNEQAQSQLKADAAVVSGTRATVAQLTASGQAEEARRQQAILAQQEAALAQVAKTAQEVNSSLASAQEKAADFARGEAQANAPVSAIPHAVGALVGLLIVFAFRKNDVDGNIRSFKEWMTGARARIGI